MIDARMYSSLVCRDEGKPNQLNASKRNTFAVPESVTVVDPRHPLYEQTFPLLHLKNRQELIPSCLVKIAEGVERLIPVSVTDLSGSPAVVFPSPVDLSSLHNLIQAFLRLEAQIGKECEDGATGSNSFDGDRRLSADGLENLDSYPTRDGAADDGLDLSSNRRTVGSGGGS
ncbi:MAG: hypothetical protein HN413_17590 [Chloroflexi bacterium]|nr:hypothetical protein [Chloroflexota bacterium]